ncbi:hypothetical protein [Thiobacillus sp.]
MTLLGYKSLFLFYLASLDPKQSIDRTKAEDGGQQKDKAHDACRNHPAIGTRQIRHGIPNERDSDHCADNTINTSDVSRHTSSLLIDWIYATAHPAMPNGMAG